MKCCEEKTKQQSMGLGIKHAAMMIACCLAPLGALLLLQQLGYEGTGKYLLLLMCPLMHFFMMKGMKHGG